MIEKTLVIAFSGGRTSGYMTHLLLSDLSYKDYRKIVIFANTGEEHPKTLEFINNCDKEFGFGTIWIEAKVHHGQRKGNTHTIVTFDTASRKGEPYEEVVKKHGIPNKAFPHCTRELKLYPINSYLRSIGLKPKDYTTAIGIRADETRRVRKDATKANIIYPLINLNVTKEDVLDWWKQQKFDLQIKEREGNCKTCWKKSDKKLFMNMRDNPEWFDFNEKLEALYPRVGPEFKKLDYVAPDRVFFRGSKSTKIMRKQFEIVKDNLGVLPDEVESGGCSESCELFPMEEL